MRFHIENISKEDWHMDNDMPHKNHWDVQEARALTNGRKNYESYLFALGKLTEEIIMDNDGDARISPDAQLARFTKPETGEVVFSHFRI